MFRHKVLFFCFSNKLIYYQLSKQWLPSKTWNRTNAPQTKIRTTWGHLRYLLSLVWLVNSIRLIYPFPQSKQNQNKMWKLLKINLQVIPSKNWPTFKWLLSQLQTPFLAELDLFKFQIKQYRECSFIGSIRSTDRVSY